MTDNYYKLIKPLHIRNPNYQNHRIQVPFKIAIVGRSGGGKTNELLNLLHKFSSPKPTFKELIIYCRNKDEPLYNFIEEKIPETQFIQVQTAADILPVNSLEDQTLVVFDDLLPLMTDKAIVKIITDYFIRARKQGGPNGVSLAFLSQNYYGIPKVVRQQLDYVILKRISSMNDIYRILSEFPIGDMKKEDFKKLYSENIKRIEDSIMIDLNRGEIYLNYNKIN